MADSSKSAWLWITLIVIAFIVLVKFLKPNEKPAGIKSEELLKKVEQLAVSTVSVQTQPLDPVSEEHQVVVFSPYQLWLKITTPKKMFEGFIPEGSTWTFSSSGQFQIKLGHTKEVILKFDGRQVPLFERQKVIVLPSES